MKKILFLFVVLFLLAGVKAWALDCTITINDTNDADKVAGYYVYKGNASGQFGEPCAINGQTLIPVGTTEISLKDLSDAEDHFVAVRVVGVNGRLSDLSGELESIRPVACSISGSWSD